MSRIDVTDENPTSSETTSTQAYLEDLGFRVSIAQKVERIINVQGAIDNNEIISGLQALLDEELSVLSEGEIEQFRNWKPSNLDELINDPDPPEVSPKLESMIALRDIIARCNEINQDLNAFKDGKISIDHLDHIPEAYRNATKHPTTRRIYTPFGVTFLIDRIKVGLPVDSKGGVHLRDSFVSIVFTDKPKTIWRQVAQHETRHNVYELLGFPKSTSGSGFPQIRTTLGLMLSRVALASTMMAHAPEDTPVRRGLQNTLDHFSTFDLSRYHIHGLKDEILANFDNLIYARGSTDMSYSRESLGAIRNIEAIFDSDRYKEVPEIQAQRERVLSNFEKGVREFYSRLSRLFFIARLGGKDSVEKLRSLLYVVDLTEIGVIEQYFRREIGPEIYDDIQAVYPIFSGFDLLRSLFKKRQKSSPESIIMSAVLGDDYYLTQLDDDMKNTDGTIKQEYLTPEFLEKIEKVKQYTDQSPENSYSKMDISYRQFLRFAKANIPPRTSRQRIINRILAG